MVVKSATKKWLMDAGMPELYAHILADERRPYYPVFYGDGKSKMNKALIKMNYEEIADCLLKNVKYPVHPSSDFYSDLGEKLQKVRQYWLQKVKTWVENYGDDIDILHLSHLKNWDIEYESWKSIKWDFLNWTENPFQTKQS